MVAGRFCTAAAGFWQPKKPSERLGPEVNPENWDPFMPEGISGVAQAAGALTGGKSFGRLVGGCRCFGALFGVV